MGSLQYSVNVRQDGNPIITNAVETINVTGIVTGTGANGIVVPANTYNMPLSCSILYAKLQSLFITCTGQITLSTNGTNAAQTLTIVIGGSTAVTFTVTYGAQTTAAQSSSVTAANLQTALQGLSSIGAGNVVVTGSPGGPYTLTFQGALGNAPLSTVTAAISGTGGSPTITPASSVTGVAPAQTFTFPAGTVLPWNLQDGFYANPITANVTQLNLTNATGAACVFTLVAGMAA